MRRPAHLLSGLAACLAILSAGCKPDVTYPPFDPGKDYFPVGEGRWIEYQVDSVYRYDLGNIRDTTVFRLREEQASPFTDLEGRPAMQLHRYRMDSLQQWQIGDIWWQVRTDQRVERSEENQRRVKLILPPTLGQYWNTNATNSLPDYELTYEEVHVPWSVNGMSFDSTILVKTTYPNNLVVRNTYYERYAKHVGLVYRQVDSSNTQINSINGQLQVTGTWYTQVITAYGQ